jgi:hypothetical protein
VPTFRVTNDVDGLIERHLVERATHASNQMPDPEVDLGVHHVDDPPGVRQRSTERRLGHDLGGRCGSPRQQGPALRTHSCKTNSHGPLLERTPVS